MANKYLTALILCISAKVSASTLLIPIAGRIHLNGELVNSTCTIFTNTHEFYIDLGSLSDKAHVSLTPTSVPTRSSLLNMPLALNVEGCAEFTLESAEKNFSVSSIHDSSITKHIDAIPSTSLVINKPDFSKVDLSFINIDELNRKLLFNIRYPVNQNPELINHNNTSFILNFTYL